MTYSYRNLPVVGWSLSPVRPRFKAEASLIPDLAYQQRLTPPCRARCWAVHFCAHPKKVTDQRSISCSLWVIEVAISAYGFPCSYQFWLGPKVTRRIRQMRSRPPPGQACPRWRHPAALISDPPNVAFGQKLVRGSSCLLQPFGPVGVPCGCSPLVRFRASAWLVYPPTDATQKVVLLQSGCIPSAY